MIETIPIKPQQHVVNPEIPFEMHA